MRADEVVGDFLPFKPLQLNPRGRSLKYADVGQNILPRENASLGFGVAAERLIRQQIVHPVPVHLVIAQRLVGVGIVEIPPRVNMGHVELRVRSDQRLHVDSASCERTSFVALFKEQDFLNGRIEATLRLVSRYCGQNFGERRFAAFGLFANAVRGELPFLARLLQVAGQFDPNLLRLAVALHEGIDDLSQFRQRAADGGIAQVGLGLDDGRKFVDWIARFKCLRVRFLPRGRVGQSVAHLVDELFQSGNRMPCIRGFEPNFAQLFGRFTRQAPRRDRATLEGRWLLEVENLQHKTVTLRIGHCGPAITEQRFEFGASSIAQNFLLT